QNIIIALERMALAGQPDRLFQPPPRPVTHHSAAQSLGRGEAESCNLWIEERSACAFASLAPPCLEDERRRRVARAAADMQELRAGHETSDCRHRESEDPARDHADRLLRPLARRLASTSRTPLVAMRARKPRRRLAPD